MNTFTLSPILLGTALLLVIILSRTWLQSTMYLHMLLQLPLLLTVGILLGWHQPWLRSIWRPLRYCDEHYLSSCLYLLITSAYWMIPNALEHAVTNSTYNTFKFITLILAGMLLPGMLRHANHILHIFLVGNLTAMTAFAGLLYQDATQRLCNSYLLDDQIVTGTGLLGYAIALPLLWGILVWRDNHSPSFQ